MSDIVTLVKTRIEAQVGGLNLVSVAANIGAAIESLSALPAVYIIRAARGAEPNTIVAGGHSQRVTEAISILIADRIAGDVSGAQTSLTVETIAQAVMTALIGWQPDTDRDPMDYVGGELADWTEPLLMVWLDDYTTVYYRRA